MIRIEAAADRYGDINSAVRVLPGGKPTDTPIGSEKISNFGVQVAAIVSNVDHFLNERKVVADLQVGARQPIIETLADKESEPLLLEVAARRGVPARIRASKNFLSPPAIAPTASARRSLNYEQVGLCLIEANLLSNSSAGPGRRKTFVESTRYCGSMETAT